MRQRHGQYRKQLWKESKLLKCGYGERWRRSAGQQKSVTLKFWIESMKNQRKRWWLGHVLRHDVLLRDILEGRMTGKCTRGSKRLQLMSNICEGYETAKKRAEDRCLWCVLVMGVSDLLNSKIPEKKKKKTSPYAATKASHAPATWLMQQTTF